MTNQKTIDGIVRPDPAISERAKKNREDFIRLQRMVRLYKRIFYILGAVIVVVGLTLLFNVIHPAAKVPDPVPLSIRRKVGFNVYFPNPAKLPSGYTLNKSSFSGTSTAVVYEVDFGNSQRLVFTVQQKPSTSDIQGFYKAHMPLAITVNTDNGTAEIGVISNETVGSLPTSTNGWVLVTAPLNTNQSRLEQVLKAMTRAE